MILRRNQDLFNTIKALAGVNDFTDNEITDLVSFTNRRLTMAYNTSPMWQRYIVTSQQRAVSSFEVSGMASISSEKPNGLYYQVGTFNDNPFYVKINPSTTNDSKLFFYKDTSVKKWFLAIGTWQTVTDNAQNVTNPAISFSTLNQLSSQIDSGDHDSPAQANMADVGSEGGSTFGYLGSVRTKSKQAVSYEGTENDIHHPQSSGKLVLEDDTIGEFIRIHRNEAFLNNSSLEYDFFVDSLGANILNTSNTDINIAFVTYKKPIVDTTTGQIITSLDTTATSNYLTQIPLEFFNYTAHGVYADFLRMDGQHDKAAFEEQKADMFLATELERIDIINNNNSLNHKFSTYVNTSSR